MRTGHENIEQLLVKPVGGDLDRDIDLSIAFTKLNAWRLSTSQHACNRVGHDARIATSRTTFPLGRPRQLNRAEIRPGPSGGSFTTRSSKATA